MKNYVYKDIRSRQRNYKEWKRGFISKESYVMEVSKCREKVRIARSQAVLVLEKEIKTNCKRFFKNVHKKRTKKHIGPLGNKDRV